MDATGARDARGRLGRSVQWKAWIMARLKWHTRKKSRELVSNQHFKAIVIMLIVVPIMVVSGVLVLALISFLIHQLRG